MEAGDEGGGGRDDGFGHVDCHRGADGGDCRVRQGAGKATDAGRKGEGGGVQERSARCLGIYHRRRRQPLRLPQGRQHPELFSHRTADEHREVGVLADGGPERLGVCV